MTSIFQTQAKLTDLRSLMAEHQLDGYLIPTLDRHLNNSSPEGLRRRAWVSGFNGSAGDLLVLPQQAWLFVDSRYHEAAEKELDGSAIAISKLGLEGHLTLLETIETLGKVASSQESYFRLGFDPFTLSIEQFNSFIHNLSIHNNIQLIPVAENLVDSLRSQSPWNQLDPIPAYGRSPLFCLSETLTGETTANKLTRVREAMRSQHIDLLPITNLNQIAWLFNLRGGDVPHIPLFIAYAIVSLNEAYLFTNLERIGKDVDQNLKHHVIFQPYELYQETLKKLVSQSPTPRLLLDPKHTTAGTYQLLLIQQSEDALDNLQIILSANPIEGMKARKNPVEIEQMKLANFKASRAKVRTMYWLSEQLVNGKMVSELDVANKIESFYQEEADFSQLTFKTIAGTGTNSSIVHYNTPNPEAILKPGSLLLLDSGAQYLAGTTDDTRTLIIGEPTPLQIERYTTVLMAHINCAMQQFPKGTTGIQLDAIARSPLWLKGLEYGHGTGHGVGAFLSGHEGPNGLHKQAQYPLEPGMITSIEPGYYEPGWGGIRIENLYVVKLLSENGLTWFGFEPITYIPFDKRLIDLNSLSQPQQSWLEQYHLTVVNKLSPTLDQKTADWLKEACSF